MKKKYLLVMELEANICEHITSGDENLEKHLNALLRVFLSDPQLISEFYRHLILTDAYNSMAAPDFSEKIKDEILKRGQAN